MTAPFHLRRPGKRDLVPLYALDRACFQPGIAYSSTDLKRFLESPRCLTWIAEDPAGELAGFIIVERMPKRNTFTGHIVTIDVASAARRRGVGRMLLAAAAHQLKEEGGALLLLEVAEDNEAAQAFYRSFGFVETGRIPNYYLGKIGALVMEKAL